MATASARSTKTGNVVWGDYLLLIYAREILSRKPGATFIGEVKCSQIMYDEIEKLGGKAIMYKTGHSLIKAKMKEEHAELAGEMSGHMFFKDRYFGFDDAIYAACRLMEIVANSGQPLSAQTKDLPAMVTTPEIRVDTSDEVKFDVVSRVRDHFKRTHQVIDVDGARVLFSEGWGLVRASNTQPVLVMRFEARTPELLEQYRREVEAVVDQVKQHVAAARLISRSERFCAAGQRFHDAAAAHSDADIHQRVQQVVQDGIDHLFGDRLLARKTEGGRDFLRDLHAQRVGQRVAGPVPLVGDHDRCLQHRAPWFHPRRTGIAKTSRDCRGPPHRKAASGPWRSGAVRSSVTVRSVSLNVNSKPACLMMFPMNSGSSSSSSSLCCPACKTCMSVCILT